MMLVIILPPVINRFPSVNNTAEPVLIQALISKSSVTTLNKSVLGWLAWQNKLPFHAILDGPLIQCAADEFRSLIGSYRRQIAMKQCYAGQTTNDLHTRNPEISSNRRALHSEIIHTGQALVPPTGGQCIHDEIHRPAQVRCILALKRKQPARQPFTTSSTFTLCPLRYTR